jgi:thiol:disulfide interchange protein DsbD
MTTPKRGRKPQDARNKKAAGPPRARTRQQNTALVVVAVFAVLLIGAIAYSQNAAAGGSAPGKATGAAANAAADGWIWNDPDAALARAKAEDKPILIDFWASWCVWCKKMDDETYPDARVKKALSGYVLLKIDVDRMPDLQKQFQADGLPTTVVVDKNGKEIKRAVGFQAPDRFVPFLTSGGA